MAMLAVLAAAVPVAAQEDVDADADAEAGADADASTGAGAGTGAAEDAVVDLTEEALVEPPGFWGLPRWHLSGIVDLGFLFLRPKFYFGWGTPHDAFVSLEVDPLISGAGFGGYGGLRGEIPWGELRVGARYFFTFTRSFLYAMDSFDHLQVRDRSGPPSRYLSLEAELSFQIPIGPVEIHGEIAGTYVTLVEEGLFAYEETLRVVLDPPFVWSAALWLRVVFGDSDEFYIQPGIEVVHLVEREDFVLRVGLRAGVRMWDDLELRLFAMPALVSPDSLGAAGGDTFLLGLRYLWATDRPEAIVEEE